MAAIFVSDICTSGKVDKRKLLRFAIAIGCFFRETCARETSYARIESKRISRRIIDLRYEIFGLASGI